MQNRPEKFFSPNWLGGGRREKEKRKKPVGQRIKELIYSEEHHHGTTGLPHTDTRINVHLSRLQTNEGVEKEFALIFKNTLSSYMTNLSSSPEKPWEDIYRVNEILGGEGLDTTLAWTVSPFILKTLKQRGIPEKQAMHKIFDWVSKADPELSIYNHFSLPGLAEANSYFDADPKTGNDFERYLILNKRIPSTYTSAEEIAKILVENGYVK